MQRNTYSIRACVGKSFAAAGQDAKSAHRIDVTTAHFTILPLPANTFSQSLGRMLAEHGQGVSPQVGYRRRLRQVES